MFAGTESWGSLDVTKDKFVVTQVVMAAPGDMLHITLGITSSLEEVLQQADTTGKSRGMTGQYNGKK